MTIQIRIEDNSERWNNLLKHSENTTAFYTWDWLKIMEKYSMSSFGFSSKAELYPLVGYKGEAPIGVFPLFSYKTPLYHIVSSPPLKTEIRSLGPLIINQTELKEAKREALFLDFQKEADRFIFHELKANYAHILSAPGIINARPFKWTGYRVEPMYTYMLDLTKGEEKIWDGFSSNLRQNVRNSEKKISIREGTKKDLEIIYSITLDRYQQQGINPGFSLEYLLDVYGKFVDRNLKLFVAEQENKTCAGILTSTYNGTIIAWIGATKTSMKGIYPNSLLQWHIIKWGINNDFKKYEIQWANSERLCKYKSKYNPDLEVYFSAKKYSSFLAKLPHMIKKPLWKR